MFSNAKVVDRVWSITYGWGTVTKIHNNYIEVHYDSGGYDYYNFDGIVKNVYQKQTLFWNEFEIPKEAYIKPLPELEVDTKVLVWDNNYKYKRYFSHFNKEGKIVCFTDGATSFSNDGLTTWDNWEIYNDN